jgi:RNA polymerase sigma-70 factor (ECF subfamily)
MSVRTPTVLTAEAAKQVERENAAIARGLKRQDPELLDQLIETYQHRLMRYLMFLTSKREVAEDLFQEVWIRVLRRGSQYNGKARFDTWIFTIARNLVIDLSRKRTMASLDEMREGGEDSDARPFEIVQDGPSPLEQFQYRENASEVATVLLTLDPAYREVLTLRFHEEMSLEEIATVTRAPLSTVKSRLYRGLAALKPELLKLRNGGIRNDQNKAEVREQEPEISAAFRNAVTANGARSHVVNRAHRVVREQALTMREQKSKSRSLWVPLAISSILMVAICYAIWGMLDGYDLTPNGVPDASDQLMILLLWSLPVTAVVLGMVWFKRARTRSDSEA